TLRLYDLTGEPTADLPIDPVRFVKQVLPLTNPLVAVVGSTGVVVVDLKARATIAAYTGSVKDATVVDGRLLLDRWDGALELTADAP
ncbi:MAG: hypothetical protein KC621_34025, partial [Myxococcales bacterium]|nr:hypothetical protein [Myxococcales bacterium]